MNNRRMLSIKEQALNQAVMEVRNRRGRNSLQNYTSVFANDWKVTQGGALSFIREYLENPNAWINNNPEKLVKGKNVKLGHMMTHRMYDYLEILGYQQEEISDFFTLAGKVNENYKAPERKEKYSPNSLDCLEGISERQWVLNQFKGELG